MIASEDRHIPKTKITHRFNPYTKSWVKKDKAPSDAPTYDQYQGVSQSRMPRSIIQTPNEGKTVFRIPGGELKDEDEQQNLLAGGQVRTEGELTQSELSSLEQADRMLDQREKFRQNAMSYGMPSENPQAKIPATPGQSGSSGVYRTKTGPITLDDMERILGSVYSEVQKCGCHHICTDPCSCSTAAQKDRIGKSGADSPVTKEEFQRAQKFSRDLKESRRQWEAENEGEYVPKEFGKQSLLMPEFADSIKKDCQCPKDPQTGTTIKCVCIVRREK